jgi:large subunit ribosomal protein L24e
VCNFSGAKIYPGHGILFVRGDSKAFRLLNAKCAAHFKSKKNPRKFSWTVFYRRLHKKGSAEEVAKRRARKTVKVQRAIVGATWEEIVARRSEPEAVKQAAREAATDDAKKKKKEEEAKKRSEKIKNAGGARASQQPKFKASQNVKSGRVQATSR